MDQTSVALLRGLRSAAALVLVTLGVAFTAAGLAAGLMSVKAGAGANCGSAFSPKDSVVLTDTGRDTCQRERSDRLSLAVALLVVGGVTLVGSAFVKSAVQVESPTEEQH